MHIQCSWKLKMYKEKNRSLSYIMKKGGYFFGCSLSAGDSMISPLPVCLFVQLSICLSVCLSACFPVLSKTTYYIFLFLYMMLSINHPQKLTKFSLAIFVCKGQKLTQKEGHLFFAKSSLINFFKSITPNM